MKAKKEITAKKAVVGKKFIPTKCPNTEGEDDDEMEEVEEECEEELEEE